MLVIHDDVGTITQCIIQAQVTLEQLAARYQKMAIPHLLHDGDVDMLNAYVVNGAVAAKPELAITGDNRPIKADGVDALAFNVVPGLFDVVVLFGNAIVHQETVTDGAIAFAADHAGSYLVQIVPPFPYRGAAIAIEAV